MVVGSVAVLPGTAAAGARCDPALVHYNHYPGQGFAQTPWLEASSLSQGLVGLLFYWPDEWRNQGIVAAQVYAGGHSPANVNMKILWRFLAPKARTAEGALLTVKGTRLDAYGKSWQRFSPISYSGRGRAPSFASIINLPAAGCWRLDLTAGTLHGSAIVRAITSGS